VSDTGIALLELGAIVIGLALLARIAGRVRLSAASLYLVAGLALGEGGLLPLVTTRSFVELGAEVGVILLLFTLGLEYSAKELLEGTGSAPWAGAVDLVLNGVPGVVTGFLLGWGLLPALVLGGVTYVSSSGIVAKLLSELGRERSGESLLVISLLLIEDLSMTLYLPVLAALAAGGLDARGLATAGLAVAGVIVLLGLGLRVEVGISRLLFSRSDEALLLTIVGFAILIAGAAQAVHASAAVGALLAGIMLSGPAAHGARVLLVPLRDLFAAIFFFFIGLAVDPGDIPPVLLLAAVLAFVGAGTKLATGWWSGRHAGLDRGARIRAGSLLIPRGEFSIVTVEVAVAAGVSEPRLVPLVVTYVLLLSVGGSLAMRIVGGEVRGSENGIVDRP
jgi:K+:H+ antiporter subunit KhtU